jgi:lipopolysaccharide cholinephosphotransferase
MNSECQCDLYPHDSLYAHKGNSVDLDKITKIRERDFAQFRLDNAIAYIERRKQLGFITEEDFEKRKKIYTERTQNDKCDSDKVILAYPFDHGKQNYEDVFPLKKYTFCGVEFLGPNNYEPLLISEYGDYMSLPPEKDRHPHYSSVKFFDKVK